MNVNAQQQQLLQEQQKQVNLSQLIDIIIRRWWIVIVAIVAAAALTYGVSEFFIEPTYISKGSLYVNTSSETNQTLGMINNSEIMTATRLVTTYIEILKSDTFLKKVAAESGLDYDASALGKLIEFTSANETEILVVEVSCHSKREATIIAQTILNNAEAELVRIVKAGSVEIIDNASSPSTPSSPNVKLNTLIGILAGMALGVLIIFMLELMDVRVRSEEELGYKYNLPVLGVIPNLKEGAIADER
ncbi:MAG: hypothetical protein IJC74_06630 [Clostridia bacterium]|nr:hypothetical protein [Clostridia bacterium]